MQRIEIKVITKARKEAVEKIGDDSYRVKVSAPPEKGKANKRVIELIAKELMIRKGAVRIVSGAASNKKIVEIG